MHVLFLLLFLFYCSGCFFNLHVVVVVFTVCIVVLNVHLGGSNLCPFSGQFSGAEQQLNKS